MMALWAYTFWCAYWFEGQSSSRSCLWPNDWWLSLKCGWPLFEVHTVVQHISLLESLINKHQPPVWAPTYIHTFIHKYRPQRKLLFSSPLFKMFCFIALSIYFYHPSLFCAPYSEDRWPFCSPAALSASWLCVLILLWHTLVLALLSFLSFLTSYIPTQHEHCSRWPDPQSQTLATNAKLRSKKW